VHQFQGQDLGCPPKQLANTIGWRRRVFSGGEPGGALPMKTKFKTNPLNEHAGRAPVTTAICGERTGASKRALQRYGARPSYPDFFTTADQRTLCLQFESDLKPGGLEPSQTTTLALLEQDCLRPLSSSRIAAAGPRSEGGEGSLSDRLHSDFVGAKLGQGQSWRPGFSYCSNQMDSLQFSFPHFYLYKIMYN